MGNSAQVPDAETLGGYSTLAANTARNHLQAAKCLLQRGFWGQAHSIAVIGFEELGKAWLSVLVMLSPDGLRQELPPSALGNHRWKLEAARSLRALLTFVRGSEGMPPTAAEALADLGTLAQEDNRAKQRGLYTDYAANRTLSSPADITEEQARTMVAVVEDVLDNAGPLVDLVTAMWVRDNVPPAVQSFLQKAADAMQAGDDAMEIFMEEELQNMGPLAGMLKDDPEWMRGVLDVAQQLGKI